MYIVLDIILLIYMIYTCSYYLLCLGDREQWTDSV